MQRSAITSRAAVAKARTTLLPGLMRLILCFAAEAVDRTKDHALEKVGKYSDGMTHSFMEKRLVVS
ncbi:MAG: hypothetical protein J5858_02455 [Lentisphaeria bacterium]|nr:hypothetical protein [Lentisphaeria bacterium]